MTSEDEGLGEDTRRDLSSGPSSLADLHESEFDAICQRLMTDETITQDSNQTKSHQSLIKDKDHLVFQVNRQKDAIDKLEKSLEQTKTENNSLKEQVLELEEAENDSRLISQRLEQQLNLFRQQYETIRSELMAAHKDIERKNSRINTFDTIEAELRLQLQQIKDILINNKEWQECNNMCTDIDIETELGHCWEQKKGKQSDNKHKKCLDGELPISGLYTFLWEKLSRIETQIDCLHQNFCQSNESLSRLTRDDCDDDLQLFISAETLSEGVSGIGSSFDANQYNISFVSNDIDWEDIDSQRPVQSSVQSSAEATSLDTSERSELLRRSRRTILSTPLCDTIKPERIDISSPVKVIPSSTHCLPPEVTDIIFKLETNEQNLKQRLSQLEAINKEFVKEIEVREKLFFEKEQNTKEYIESEIRVRKEIDKLKDRIKDITKQRQTTQSGQSGITDQQTQGNTPKDAKCHYSDSQLNVDELMILINYLEDPNHKMKGQLNDEQIHRVIKFLRSSVKCAKTNEETTEHKKSNTIAEYSQDEPQLLSLRSLLSDHENQLKRVNIILIYSYKYII